MYIYFSQKAFTLIEIIIVVGILGTISGVGIASYSKYNEHEQVRQTTLDIASALNLARSRTQSQVFPSGLTCLSSYFVYIESNYSNVLARCKNPAQPDVSVSLKYFPPGVTASPAPKYFLFNTLSGSVENAGGTNTITISKNGYSKSVTVSNSGTIGVN